MIDQSQLRFSKPNWLNTQRIFGPVQIFLANVNFHLLGFSFLKDAFGLFTSSISTTSSKEVDKKQWFIKRLFMLLCQSFCSAEMHPVQINLFDSINIAGMTHVGMDLVPRW